MAESNAVPDTLGKFTSEATREHDDVQRAKDVLVRSATPLSLTASRWNKHKTTYIVTPRLAAPFTRNGS
jgi:hypothetical protein